MAKFVRQALAGELLIVYRDGRQTRDFIYIKDLIGAIRAAASTPGIACEVFQKSGSHGERAYRNPAADSQTSRN